MKTLTDRTNEVIKRRRQSLKEAISAKKLISQLPDALQQLDGEADTGYYGQTLTINYYAGLNEGVDILKVCKITGVQGLSPLMSEAGNWTADGEFAIDEDKLVRVHLYGLDKPLNCIIEVYEDTVKKYKAICEDTGKEVAAS